ncbi:hypothetical protein [Prescottella subtropica]|uniref:hypothetical protein n=1 Tax=Prescottella subtropica TaxID=2545757 RepID=UPI0010F6E2D6|nr:hypothetical protein [Prescottella subtropica]
MLTAAAFVPSPPLLVPGLAGAAASETDAMRTAALAVAGRLGAAADWTVLGVRNSAVDAVDTHVAGIGPDTRGTFAGYGVDERVRLAPDANGPVDPELPLAALIAGWLRGQAAPATRIRVRLLDAGTPAGECARIGAALRAELDADPAPHGLLVVADGANTLTDKAPGAFDPRSGGVQAALDDALAAGDAAALTGLDADVCAGIGLTGRAVWQALAAVFGPSGPAAAESLYAGAPYGVGYHVGMWRP